MNKIELQPIGFVISRVTKRMDENWGENKSKIILKPEFAFTLLGIERFFHTIIPTYLDQANYEKKNTFNADL